MVNGNKCSKMQLKGRRYAATYVTKSSVITK